MWSSLQQAAKVWWTNPFWLACSSILPLIACIEPAYHLSRNPIEIGRTVSVHRNVNARLYQIDLAGRVNGIPSIFAFVSDATLN